MLKRDTFLFISNLHYLVCNPKKPITLLAEAYLLSEHHTTPEMIDLALYTRKRRNLIVSDNGSFSLISCLACQFGQASEKLLETAKKEQSKLGQPQPTTLKKRAKLVKEVAIACQKTLDNLDKSSIVANQLKIKPHYLMGLEDLTIPTLNLCGLLDPVFAPDPAEVLPYQEQTYKLFCDEVSGSYGHFDQRQTKPFLVIHAYDYDSAYQGGKLLKAQGYTHSVAISYGGAMESDRQVNGVSLYGHFEQFAQPLPEKYLMAQNITMGVLNGIDNCSRLHLLGLGSPILIALTAGLLNKCRAVSIDSTCPFKDSYDGFIYQIEPALLKTDMISIAARCLVKGQGFRGSSPYWRDFDRNHPSDWPGLRVEMGVNRQSDPGIVAQKLRSRPELRQRYIPFFSDLELLPSPLSEDLKTARAGHNYWILRTICHQIRERRRNPKLLSKWIAGQVNKYCAVADPEWALAVRTAYELTKRYGQ